MHLISARSICHFSHIKSFWSKMYLRSIAKLMNINTLLDLWVTTIMEHIWKKIQLVVLIELDHLIFLWLVVNSLCLKVQTSYGLRTWGKRETNRFMVGTNAVPEIPVIFVLNKTNWTNPPKKSMVYMIDPIETYRNQLFNSIYNWQTARGNMVELGIKASSGSRAGQLLGSSAAWLNLLLYICVRLYRYDIWIYKYICVNDV